MNTGWYFVFALFIGLPLIMALGFSFVAWLRYRYMRAALDALKSYAATGRDPPEALVKALTEGARSFQAEQGSWGSASTYQPAPDDADADPRDWVRASMVRRRYRRKHSAVYAWRQAFFWAAMTAGFWYAAEYVSSGDTQTSLKIVAIIMGAVTVAATLGALLTTVVRANDRLPE